MKVVVDTPIWSEFLRRSKPKSAVVDILSALIAQDEEVLIGPIRQEILSGIKMSEQYECVRLALRAFLNEPIVLEDYEAASAFSNLCRASGVQGSSTDFLVCAVSIRLRASIYTLDQDFERFRKIIPIKLYLH